MISMVIPTRNRAHTLRRVASSYATQQGVTELIFVSDASTDDTDDVIEDLARSHPQMAIRLLRNETRQGAAHCRNTGANSSCGEYVLFCDDDEYLEQGYASTLLDKLMYLDAGAVSGRRIYLQNNESPNEALRRFGNGLRRGVAFHPAICEYVNGAIFSGDITLPITNANILTRRSLLIRFPFDEQYRAGNGYREESDFQMNLFVNGYRIYMTNDCHSFHLPLSDVRSGGQRTVALKRIYWSIHHTRYFFLKYYERYALRLKLGLPRSAALAAFAVFAVYRELLRPPIHRVAVAALGCRRRSGDWA